MKEIKIQFYNGDEMIIKNVEDFTIVNSYLYITRNGNTEEFESVQFLVYCKYQYRPAAVIPQEKQVNSMEVEMI